MNTTPGGIYAIYDTIARVIIGGLVVFPHVAAAIRYFKDVASIEGSVVNKNVEDYHLIQLGTLTDDQRIVALDAPELVLSGKAYRATNDTTTEA